MGPTFTVVRLTGEAPGFAPAVSSWLRRRPSRRPARPETAERDAIIWALDATGGNKSEAADLLGMGRTTLYRLFRQLGLESGEATM
jgi:sigma-54 dependent transcriptional regulator, acetoin dehydrogenase operon transcriptional activator AcoR